MRWREDWPERPPRPKIRRLAAAEQRKLLDAMTRAVARSPILTAFGIQVRFLRGRFYIERRLSSGLQIWGRITPVAASKGELLLEAERQSGNWFELATGSAVKLMRQISSDTKGTFHGLGTLDASLRRTGQGLTRLPMKVKGKARFVYAGSGERCSAQEALFHFFGLPGRGHCPARTMVLVSPPAIHCRVLAGP